MNSRLTSLNSARPVDGELEKILEAAIVRLQAGEPIEVEALAAAHSKFASDIREIWPAAEMMVRMGGEPLGPDARANATNGHAASPPEHKQLGDFRLIRQIGQGGMGTVYEAEQLTMGRHVALKVLPFAALVQEKSLQRFRNEVRAAAALDHPHIVSIYSVGEERGVHFYAMQLIRGQTLADVIAAMRQEVRGQGSGEGGAEQTNGRAEERKNGRAGEQQKSDDNDPTTDYSTPPPLPSSTVPQARLSTAAATRHDREYYRSAARLGIQAAEALQHAHDLGVLHRDIKPSNLMVDREGQLFITDFGLARIEADAGLTMTGDIIGTLRYMAPEQALAKRVVIDHRADIYSLGATLFELLTLQPAFGEIDRSELLKHIAFEEPTRLRKLDRHIPPELETIVLKAMEKSPEGRYQTAAALASDLRAYLEDQPIKAKPPTMLNRTAKWSRRHRGFLMTTAVVLIILSIASLISTGLLLSERERTKMAAAESQTVVNFLVNDLLSAQKSSNGRVNPKITVSEALDRAAAQIDAKFADQPLVEAALRDSIATAFNALGTYVKAEPHATKALQLRTDLLGPNDSVTIRSTETLARSIAWQENRGHEENRLMRAAVDAARSTFGETRDTLATMKVAFEIFLSRRPAETRNGEYMQNLCDNGFTLSARLNGPMHEDTVYWMEARAAVRLTCGNYDEGQRLLQETLEFSRRSLGDDHFRTSSALSNLGRILKERGHPEEAVKLLEQSLESSRNGETRHRAMQDLAGLYSLLGRDAEALQLSAEVLKRATGLFGPDHLQTLSSTENHVVRLHNAGKIDEALKLLDELVPRARLNLQPDDALMLNVLQLQGSCLHKQGKLPESYDVCLKVLQDHLPKGDPRRCKWLNWAGNAADDLGRVEQAFEHYDEALEIEPNYIAARVNRAQIHSRNGRDKQAIADYEQVFSLPQSQWHTAIEGAELEGTLELTLNSLAWLLATSMSDELRDGKRAIELATKACEMTEYKDPWKLTTLSAAHAESGDFSSAVKWCKQAIASTADDSTRIERSKILESFENGRPWRPTPAERLEMARTLAEAGASFPPKAGEALSADGDNERRIETNAELLARAKTDADRIARADVLDRELRAKGGVHEVITFYRQLVADRPQLTEAKIRLIEALHETYELDTARAAEESLRRTTGAQSAFRRLGKQAAQRLDWARAVGYLEWVRRSNVSTNESQRELDCLYSAPALIRNGDHVRYNEFREECVVEYGHSRNPRTAERLSRAILLLPCRDPLPEALEHWSEVLELADNQFADNSDTKIWGRVALALLEYRLGNWEQSAEWCHKGLAMTRMPHRDAMFQVVLSMNYERLERHDEAKAELGLVAAALDKAHVDGKWQGPWFDWEFARILRDEARELIEGQPTK